MLRFSFQAGPVSMHQPHKSKSVKSVQPPYIPINLGWESKHLLSMALTLTKVKAIE